MSIKINEKEFGLTFPGFQVTVLFAILMCRSPFLGTTRPR